MQGYYVATFPGDSDAEAACHADRRYVIAACQDFKGDLAGGCCKAETASADRGRFLICGGRRAALVAVTTLGAAGVFSVAAAFTGSVPSRNESISFVDAATVAAEAPSLGAAVCVLGQLSRLEIQSKLQNIIEPLASITNVDVFLSLESGNDGVFNNRQTINKSGASCSSSEMDENGARAAFAPYFRDGVFGPHVTENVNLTRWPMLYLSNKHASANGSADSDNARRDHISNVLGQMRHLRDCAELIKQSEDSAGGQYDIVVKVRDNTIALRPVVPEKLMSITEVTLKHCQWWGGVNDKVMALPRRYLEKTMGAVYPAMHATNYAEDPESEDPHLPLLHVNLSKDTEQIMMWTLIGNKVPYRERAFEIGDPDGEDYLPFVDGRCSPSEKPGGEGRWCIVSHCKDCWPSQPWTLNVTCAQRLPHEYWKLKARNVSVTLTVGDPDPTEECFNGIYR
jgi:hypothetical protein